MSQDRDARFRATVYAMNTLLIRKGVYSPKEFHFLFMEGMDRENGRLGHPAANMSEDKAKMGSK